MTLIGSLFSGAGGLDLAAHELFPGADMAWHAEIEPAAARVLAHHWPGVPNLGDIERVGLDYSDEEWGEIKTRAGSDPEFRMPLPDWHAVESVDVLCGGFPCQDVSAAGRRAGLAEGTRSGLWSHMAAAIDVLRPRYVLIENVRGLLSAPAIRRVESDRADVGHMGAQPALRALGAVLGDLADLGFDAEWTCVRASTVGACHRRERVFVLAWPADAEGGGRKGVDDSAGGEAARSERERLARRGARGDAPPVTLLPTPRAGDGTKGGPNQRGSSGDLMLPSAAVSMLPTPSVADATGGHKSRSGDRIDELLLPGLAVAHAEGALLPTPKTTDNHHSSPADLGRRSPGLRAVDGLLPSPTTSDANGHGRHGNGGPDLRTTIVDLLPTPMARDGLHGGQHPDRREGHTQQLVDTALAHGTERWGRYAGAIARQAAVCGRPAPSPTEIGSRGNPRLAAAFAEWMMMWPDGWVTDPEIGLTRNEQLHAIGNGVCPPQAVAGFRYLLGIAEGVIS